MNVQQSEFEFAVELQGIVLLSPIELNVPSKALTGRLEPGQPIRFTLRIGDGDELTRRATAGRIVNELYRRLLLQFGGDIEYSVSPRLTRSPLLSQGQEISHSVDAVVAPRHVALSKDIVEEVTANVARRIVTPEVVTSADLYTAIDMYVAGLESRNKIVRYLILYSAVGLACLFKRAEVNQRAIDDLLRAANPKLQMLSTPSLQSNRGRRSTESIYAKLRNDFIHAEERPCSPAEAISRIEGIIPVFQRDVAKVLSGL